MPRTKGATADKFWNEAVRLAVYRETEDDDGKKHKRINLIADKLCKLALEGDMQAIKEIGDRLDGKPAQAVDVAGQEEDGSIGITFKTVIEQRASD
ncbi:MAG: hypothetical protein AAGL17_14420 [Cyanobacteria bacterium J06576_12]